MSDSFVPVRRLVVVASVLVGLAFVPGANPPRGQERHPIYVGARVCATCHEGPSMGHQFSRWSLSRHARAYASLATPAAREMARISGIPGEPQESAVCLGCHATASETEAWERDPTFRLEDGVQCERCHGPGSEYMDAAVMRDREAAERAGLQLLMDRECRLCHYEKGSHVAVHGRPPIDLGEGRRTIAHPTPVRASSGSLPESTPSDPATPGPAYVGAQVCATCHRGPAHGYTYSVWRESRHARAYAVLATDEAREIVDRERLSEDPQQSARCLACHATAGSADGAVHLDPFDVADGVGCESCHGPGSVHAAAAAAPDPGEERASGLAAVGPETCAPCHAEAHGKPFAFDEAVATIAHPDQPPELASTPRYKTPVNLALSPDGRQLYVACEASNSVVVVDAVALKKVAEIPVGGQPHDVCFSPDGDVAYVSNRLDDSVSVIDVRERRVVAEIPVGDEPHGLLTDAAGGQLFVVNTAADSLSVIDTHSLTETKRLATSRNPWSLARSPDGRSIVVTNNLARFVEFRTPLESEVTVIDAERATVQHRATVPAANLIQGVAWHPQGEFALFTLNRTKNLVPMTRIVQGWTITNGLGVLWNDGRVDQVLLDEPNMHFPDAADVAFTPDGRQALVTSSGSDRVALVDVPELVAMLRGATARERSEVIPNHLGKSTRFVVKHVSTGKSPRGVAVDPLGERAFVANALDDSLSVIDLASGVQVAQVDLGGSQEITRARWGEQLFHSADIAFQRQFSCHSCHPDGHVDGITYDIEPDGIGLNPVDNRTLRGILDTAPFKWTGKNPTLSRQCGPRLAVFFTRIEPFEPDELAAVEEYIRTIPRPPNRHRPLGAPLTEAQRRGKAMFERTRTNDGRPIPESERCVSCHFPPLFTNREVTDVGTMMALDTHGKFDVPHLSNIYDSAPYLHNGIAETLEEIWTRYNPDDRHGMTNDMTKDQLNDLIEYLKTL